MRSTRPESSGSYDSVLLIQFTSLSDCFTNAFEQSGKLPSAAKPHGMCRPALVLGRTAGMPQPQRHLGWLHRLVDHCEQLGGERFQLDLLAQADAEPLDRLGRVVAAAVEALIDGCLDALPRRLKQRCHCQRRAGNH